jgi:hypothetical protein
MKRLIALVAGGFGIAAYLRRRSRRGTPEVAPADELRAKLAQSKAERPAADVPEPLVTAVEPKPDPDALDDRRRDVHDSARAAIDELR